MARMGNFDYSQLKDFVKRVEENLSDEQIQKFIESCAKAMARQLLRMVKERTPVGEYDKPVSFTTKDGKEVNFTPRTGKMGGTLRRGWTAEQQQNVTDYVNGLQVTRNGDTYTIELVNPVKYASYVEFGHKKRNNKGWVEGRFYLTIAAKEVQNAAPGILERKLKRKLEEAFR